MENWVIDYWPHILFLAFAFFLLFSAAFTVEQQTAVVVQRLGKFSRIAHPGLNFKIPIIESTLRAISLRIEQADVDVETKTSDNVFVKVTIAVQYFVQPSKVYDAVYKLSYPQSQIEAYVFDVVRSNVPGMKLDELFENKNRIAQAVKDELTESMENFGFSIATALVTNIDPDERVKAAMNEINAAQRQRVAANEKGEAEKILLVKQAEAEAESKALQGQGIADQRRAIIQGLKSSVEDFQESVKGVSAEEVMRLVILTQYFDTLKEIGANAETNTILLPHGPGAITDMSAQILAAMKAGLTKSSV